jgi:hypothetical protein
MPDVFWISFFEAQRHVEHQSASFDPPPFVPGS